MNRLIATYKGHYKALFYLGLPIVIGQMGVIVLGFADTLMVGHHSTAEWLPLLSPTIFLHFALFSVPVSLMD